MDIFGILMFIGGLALSLYGMNTMSSGLERISGGKLERAIEKATDSRIKGVLIGAGVTALIQSSSATTVMAVGFVNSGLMKLSQAIGIIMGANIGTTVTPWILSLAGLTGGAWYIDIFKPMSFSPVLALIGVVLLLFAKSQRKKEIGHILLGFAVLMFGMSTMGDAVKPLAEDAGFMRVLTLFQNPLLGVLAGALLTGVIQSSAAAVGMLQAISVTGGITYGAAIPIILGMNIGTCVTAIISCIGANRSAKRTAMVHLYFNIVGTFVCLAIFYIINAIWPLSITNDPLNAASIAIIHTVFNVVSTAVLFPFAEQLGVLATLTVRDRAQQPDPASTLLDERFLATPTFALAQTRTVTEKMALLAREMLLDSLNMVGNYSPAAAQTLNANEEHVDLYEDKIGSYLVKLSAEKLSQQDSNEIGKLLHVIGDFERIGDHALNIMESAEEIYSKNLQFSEAAENELSVVKRALKDILNTTIDAFITEDIEKAAHVEPLEQVIDILVTELRDRHIRRVSRGECTIEHGFVFTDLLQNIERTSDHCSNIAACLLEMHESSFDTHRYLNAVKQGTGSTYMREVEEYSKNYQLD